MVQCLSSTSQPTYTWPHTRAGIHLHSTTAKHAETLQGRQSLASCTGKIFRNRIHTEESKVARVSPEQSALFSTCAERGESRTYSACECRKSPGNKLMMMKPTHAEVAPSINIWNPNSNSGPTTLWRGVHAQGVACTDTCMHVSMTAMCRSLCLCPSLHLLASVHTHTLMPYTHFMHTTPHSLVAAPPPAPPLMLAWSSSGLCPGTQLLKQ